MLPKAGYYFNCSLSVVCPVPLWCPVHNELLQCINLRSQIDVLIKTEQWKEIIAFLNLENIGFIKKYYFTFKYSNGYKITQCL